MELTVCVCTAEEGQPVAQAQGLQAAPDRLAARRAHRPLQGGRGVGRQVPHARPVPRRVSGSVPSETNRLRT
eukprot:2611099-Rhodomonas_salina.1